MADMLFDNRSGKGAINSPPSPQPTIYDVSWKPSFDYPVLEYHRLSIKGKKCISAVISQLLKPRCPSAILRAIISIVVNAVYCMRIRRASAHIRKKIGEAIFPYPPRANAYPASAIIMISAIFWIVASFYHCSPCRYFWSLRKSVGSVAFSRRFTQQATAAFGSSRNKTRMKDNFFFPAQALTQPPAAVSLSFAYCGALNHLEPSECFTYKVRGFHGKLPHYVLRHSDINICH